MKTLPTVEYNPYSLPPRTVWTFAVNIPRNSVGPFCEHLHLLIEEKKGASIFAPDAENERNFCRFEWNRKWNGDQFGIRIGVSFAVSKDPLSEIQGYVTTKDLVSATEGTPVTLDAGLATLIRDEIFEVIHSALHWENVENSKKEWCVVFHISVPHTLGFSQNVEAASGRFRFLKTRIVPKELKRVSAVVVRCSAGFSVLAKQKASSEVMIILALLTLLERSKYELVPQKWPRSRGFNNVFPAARKYNEDRLYPSRRYSEELEVIDQSVIQRFDESWAAYEALQGADRKIFTRSLLAYYAAFSLNSNFSTISLVGYISALAALSKALQKKCKGEITCSLHGPLSFQHDEISETKAIIETIINVCSIEDEAQRRLIKKLIQRTHAEQRSAFVHGAQIRHAEFSQGGELPPAIPVSNAVTSEFFAAREDLVSISEVTRRTLIEWLEINSGRQVDRDKMRISTELLIYRPRVTASVVVRTDVMTQIATRPPAI